MLEAFALSDKGCIRPKNEDFCLVDPDQGLFILADGMGGARAGDRASRLAVDTVAQIVNSANAHDSQVLLRAIEEANRRVLGAASTDPALEGMGTTVVAVLEVDSGLSIASVGDSRAYLHDGSGFRAITKDQTWVNDVGRPLGLDEESLRNHPMRHVLTMAIGVGATISIDYHDVKLTPDALVLLSSDGLHGVVPADQIRSILNEPPQDLEGKCRKLIDAARNAGGPDNITVVLIRALQ
jgi:protein phosphatase